MSAWLRLLSEYPGRYLWFEKRFYALHCSNVLSFTMTQTLSASTASQQRTMRATQELDMESHVLLRPRSCATRPINYFPRRLIN